MRDTTQFARRAFLTRATTGIGSMPPASLLDPRLLAASVPTVQPARSDDRWPGKIRPLHIEPRAQRVFQLCMAGVGIIGGVSYGQIDELGYHAALEVVRVHDLHATILHQLGVDRTRHTYKFQGRDFGLTGVSGRGIEQILT